MEIFVMPEEAWDFAQNYKDELKDVMLCLAEEHTYGVEVFLDLDESGVFNIIVNEHEDEVYSETVIDQEDCCDTLHRIYNEFLLIEADDDYSYEQRCDIINEHEDRIDDAIVDLLIELLGNEYDKMPDGFLDERFDELKERIIDACVELGINVWRPMFVDDSGEEIFIEYPYENVKE